MVVFHHLPSKFSTSRKGVLILLGESVYNGVNESPARLRGSALNKRHQMFQVLSSAAMSIWPKKPPPCQTKVRQNDEKIGTMQTSDAKGVGDTNSANFYEIASKKRKSHKTEAFEGSSCQVIKRHAENTEARPRTPDAVPISFQKRSFLRVEFGHIANAYSIFDCCIKQPICGFVVVFEDSIGKIAVFSEKSPEFRKFPWNFAKILETSEVSSGLPCFCQKSGKIAGTSEISP